MINEITRLTPPACRLPGWQTGQTGIKTRGFTLPEVLIGTVLTILVVSGGVAVYVMSQTSWHEGMVEADLQTRASLSMQKMVRGMGRNLLSAWGIYGIRDAKSANTTGVTPPNPGTVLEFTGTDNVNRSFYLSGDQLIYYDPNRSPATEVITDDVSSLSFYRGDGSSTYGSENRVRIELTLQDEVRDKQINVTLTTDVALRN